MPNNIPENLGKIISTATSAAFLAKAIEDIKQSNVNVNSVNDEPVAFSGGDSNNAVGDDYTPTMEPDDPSIDGLPTPDSPYVDPSIDGLPTPDSPYVDTPTPIDEGEVFIQDAD